MQPGRLGRERYFGGEAPGVYLETEFRPPHREFFSTGVPAFLGLMPQGAASRARGTKPQRHMISLWSHFEHYVGKPTPGCYLAYAVRGFFENGGHWCYVVVLKDDTRKSLEAGLEAISDLDTVDLVCAPDLARDKGRMFELQQIVVKYCEDEEQPAGRFAVLDSRPQDDGNDVVKQWSEIDGKDGAIYYPWVKVRGFDGGLELVPPCGHVAGVFARTDRSQGVHKAPANEVLEGVIDLERRLSNADQAQLNKYGVNCLRSFPGRGIRVWGARTLSGQAAWTYVNVRRLFLTAARWIEWNMSDIPFEPNSPRLWKRIERELTTYFTDLYRKGALKGGSPQQAFYVKCNEETNPRELLESGQVVTEIGLAPTVPYEFVVVRLIHGSRGTTITGPTQPGNLS